MAGPPARLPDVMGCPGRRWAVGPALSPATRTWPCVHAASSPSGSGTCHSRSPVGQRERDERALRGALRRREPDEQDPAVGHQPGQLVVRAEVRRPDDRPGPAVERHELPGAVAARAVDQPAQDQDGAAGVPVGLPQACRRSSRPAPACGSPRPARCPAGCRRRRRGAPGGPGSATSARPGCTIVVTGRNARYPDSTSRRVAASSRESRSYRSRSRATVPSAASSVTWEAASTTADQVAQRDDLEARDVTHPGPARVADELWCQRTSPVSRSCAVTSACPSSTG